MNDLPYFPKVYIRKIEGGLWLDEKFKALQSTGVELNTEKDLFSFLSMASSLILKPSNDSDSGYGVVKFLKAENSFCDTNGNTLTLDFLKSYGDNFVLQECVQQHPFFASFNKESVNTMRLCLYRSVADEEVIMIGGVLRIGTAGSFLDNAHAGGKYVGIDVSNGELGHSVYDQNGRAFDTWNSIDFKSHNYQIPYWKDIKKASKQIASKNLHCRLIALDMTLTPEGKPIMIEENVRAFSYWMLQFSGQICFGDRTDEVIEYCMSKKNQIH